MQTVTLLLHTRAFSGPQQHVFDATSCITEPADLDVLQKGRAVVFEGFLACLATLCDLFNCIRCNSNGLNHALTNNKFLTDVEAVPKHAKVADFLLSPAQPPLIAKSRRRTDKAH